MRPGQAVGDDEARVAERPGQRRPAGRRRACVLQVAEEVGQAAAGQARAQQADEEGRGHADERADREPEDGLRARARHEVVGQQRGEEQQRRAAGDARQQRAPARARRRRPAHRDHDRDGHAGQAGQRALALVDHVGDVGVRERGQQVAVLLVEQQPDDLQDPQREHERRPPAASPPATRAVRRSGASAAAPRRTAPTSPARGSTAVCAIGASNWPTMADRKKPTPAPAMSRPLRLSGRRRQAMRPQAANDPPMSR